MPAAVDEIPIASPSDARATDEDLSFPEVYGRNAAFVWRVLRRLGVPSADLEDVCQEVFLVVHRKLRTFDRSSSSRTWLYGIALRCAANHRRRAHLRRESSSPIPDRSADPTQAVAVAQLEARAQLDTIIEELDDDKRAVFVLFELEELPMATVAEAVGCPLQTAYSRLHAARQQVESAVKRLRAKEVS